VRRRRLPVAPLLLSFQATGVTPVAGSHRFGGSARERGIWIANQN
jgi:hypothetical protein